MKLKVSSRPEKFRRAGLSFTRDPKEVDVDAKKAEILRGEKLLAVEEVKAK